MNACDTDMANGYTGWNTCVTVRFTRARAPVATTRDGENANRAPRAVRLSLASASPFVGADSGARLSSERPRSGYSGSSKAPRSAAFREDAPRAFSTRRTRRGAAEKRSETSGAGRGRSSGAAARSSYRNSRVSKYVDGDQCPCELGRAGHRNPGSRPAGLGCDLQTKRSPEGFASATPAPNAGARPPTPPAPAASL